MTTVRVSPKFQVVIPKDIRKKMGIKAGAKIEMIQYENRLEFIPIGPVQKLRGSLKGINTDVPRDEDRV